MAQDWAYQEAEQKIEQAGRTGATELSLRSMGLTALPESLGQLAQLQELDLSSNRLSSLPESLGQLTQLQTLGLLDNQLTALPESMGQLTQLQRLRLQGNQLTVLPEWLGQLTQLQKLELHVNQLTSLPESLGQLTQLQTLFLLNNQLTALPESLGQLTQLRTLFLQSNQLTVLPKSLGQLTQMQRLLLDNNQLTALPESLGQLTLLRRLSLRNNQLTALPESVSQLTQLHTLELDKNPLTDPPPSVVDQGTEAVLAYLREKATRGERPHWRSKMLLVGEGGVGKTQLLRRLKGEGFETQSETTHGIDVRELELKHPVEPATKMTLNCWDFGGQQIYHATHQFFLTGRSLFLLCWSARIGHEASKLGYWLDTINSLAPEAPIILVATHGDERDAKLPYDGLKKKFPQIVGQWTVSSKDKPDDDKKNDPAALADVEKWKKSITSLFEEIRTVAADKDKLPLMGAPWPTSYFNAAEALRALEKTEITRDELFDLFEQSQVTDEKSKETLAHLLHDLGDILWFHDDEELKDLVLLDAEWIDRRVSDVLECQDVIDAHGVFTHQAMRALWPDVAEPMCRRLLHLMEKFDLSYEIPDDKDNRSLVVERLTEDPPKKFETMWETMHPSHGFREVSMRWELKMRRPAGVPTWFIARTHRFTTDTHWLYGALFADHREASKRKHLALVNAPPGERFVELTVRGPNPHAFFVLLKDGLELTLERFPGMMRNLERKVRCAGHDHTPCSFLFDYSYLERAMLREPPVLEVQCQSSFESVSVPGLLMGIHWTADSEVTRLIHEAEKKILAGQHEMKEELQSLRELAQLEFSRNFARDQRLEETHTPSVFTLRPKGSRQWAKGFVGQTWELRLWCEYPGGWHWNKDWPVYEIKEPAKWLDALAPHLKRLFKVMRFAAPLAGPLTGYAFNEYAAMLKDDIELMKGLIDGFKELNIDFETPEAGAAGFDVGGRYGDSEQRPGKAQGVPLLELRRMLDANAPDWQTTCKIRKILTPENHYLWLCEEHIKEYLI